MAAGNQSVPVEPATLGPHRPKTRQSLGEELPRRNLARKSPAASGYVSSGHGRTGSISLFHQNARQYLAKTHCRRTHTAGMPHPFLAQSVARRRPRTEEVLAWAGIPARNLRHREKSQRWRRRQEQFYNLTR